MAPRVRSSERERRGKGIVRDALAALAAISGRSAAQSAGVPMATLRTIANPDRPNLPSAAVLRGLAAYLTSAADELRTHARQLTQQANAVEREHRRQDAAD